MGKGRGGCDKCSFGRKMLPWNFYSWPEYMQDEYRTYTRKCNYVFGEEFGKVHSEDFTCKNFDEN